MKDPYGNNNTVRILLIVLVIALLFTAVISLQSMTAADGEAQAQGVTAEAPASGRAKKIIDALAFLPLVTKGSPKVVKPEPPTNTPVPATNTAAPPTTTPVTPEPTNAPGAPTSTPEQPPKGGAEYFISPSGSDSRSGTSADQAWATFNKAWSKMKAGDTLTLMDGVYYQSIEPSIRGQAGRPVTVRALHDGQAIIDGEGIRWPVKFNVPDDYYFVIRGIVARNSVESVYLIAGNHIEMRRVSGYNARKDYYEHVFTIMGHHNLLEDCIASGTGVKMVLVFQGSHNTIRRCLADWRQWDGRGGADVNTCAIWPWGEGLEFYGASNNIMENAISYGQVPRAGISIMSQYPQSASGNKILGTMSIYTGMNHDGSPTLDPWPTIRPQPTDCTQLTSPEWPNQLAGFSVGESGQVRDNLLQDILAWGSQRYGISFFTPGNPEADFGNNRVNRATIVNNGLANIDKYGGIGAGALKDEMALIDTLENSYVENITEHLFGSNFVTIKGEGARLEHRYVDGVLTGEPLWPWPMEDRVQAELGYSITEVMTGIISTLP